MSTIETESQQRAATLRALVKGVAKALGATANVNPEHDHYGKVTTAEGVTLGLYLGYGRGGRLEVSPCFPMSEGRQQVARDLLTHEESKADAFTTSITCDPARGPEKIAADIARRLLPSATTLHARAVERARKAEEWAAGRELTLTTLAQRLKCEVRPGRMDLYPGGVSLNVSGPDSVSIERIYCKAETAARIVELLRDAKAGDADSE